MLAINKAVRPVIAYFNNSLKMTLAIVKQHLLTPIMISRGLIMNDLGYPSYIKY